MLVLPSEGGVVDGWPCVVRLWRQGRRTLLVVVVAWLVEGQFAVWAWGCRCVIGHPLPLRFQGLRWLLPLLVVFNGVRGVARPVSYVLRVEGADVGFG